jgi:hypothetical protein
VRGVTQQRLRLKQADFAPLAVDGKKCHLIGWTSKTAVTETEIVSWEACRASSNTGILTKHTPAFDIDILNVDAADAVEELVRRHVNVEPLVRIGFFPKRLIPFRTNKPFSKIPIRFIGTKEKLEFLGDGQQYVAFGVHPDTGQPYTWRGGEPGEVPRAALPEIDAEAACELIDAAADLLVGRFGYQRVELKGYPRSVCGDPVLVADLTAALREMDPRDWNHCEHDPWFELLMGCKFVGISLADFVEWSTSDPDYVNEADEIARQWRSVEPRHGGAFYAALKARGITVHHTLSGVPLQSNPSLHSPTRNVGARLNSISAGFRRNPTEPMLFSWGCLLAEVLHECKLTPPRKYIGLLESAAMETPLWTTLGPEGVRRTIDRAFAHVEARFVDRVSEGDAA